MASLINRPNGHRWIQFVDGAGRRQTIRLGKVPKRVAESVLSRVEELIAHKLGGIPPSRDLSLWLVSIPRELHNKLAKAGLCESRASATLGDFIKDYIESRRDVKPATKEIWRQGEMGLVGFFGRDKLLGDGTSGDADRYKLHLIGSGLAPMTVRKRLQFATMVFRAATRMRLIPENPFSGVSIKASMPNRSRFITREETQRLLEACPNHHWRAIVALSRYGG
ncbi:MAG: hypothetical protein ACUVQG_11705 [Thermogutta sp.]